MSGLYWGEDAKLKSYAANSKGGLSIVKIEIHTTEPYQLASILKALAEIEAEEKVSAKAGKPRRSAADRERD